MHTRIITDIKTIISNKKFLLIPLGTFLFVFIITHSPLIFFGSRVCLHENPNHTTKLHLLASFPISRHQWRW